MTPAKKPGGGVAPLWSARKRLSVNGVAEPTKYDLVNQLVVFTVERHEPQFVTQFGVKPKTTASLYVLSGPLSGEFFESWSVVGPMASQMASFAPGAPQGARVTKRTSSNGRQWIGIDTNLTAADEQAVAECLAWDDPSSSRGLQE